MRKLILFTLVIAIIFISLWFFKKNLLLCCIKEDAKKGEIKLPAVTPATTIKESNPIKPRDSETKKPNSYTVVFDMKGKFTPVYLKIKKGDIVVWANEGSGNIWPAVGPHPTHDLYPKFDAKQAIKPGEKFYFTFDRAGVWQYHNHLAGGQMVGIVEVSE